MMKKGLRLVALLLVLLLTLPMANVWAEDTTESTEDPVLFTIGDTPYLASQVENMLLTLYDYGYVTSDTDYLTAIEYILYTCAEQNKLTEMGFDQFTDAEREVYLVEAQAELDALVDEWMVYYQTGAESEDELAELRTSILEYFASMGYDVYAVLEETLYNVAFDKLVAYLEENYDVAATDEDVEAYFLEGVEADRAMYEGNVEMYEMYTTYYGTESWYIPSGYRAVLQILLEVDETLLNDYLTKKEAYDAAQNADASAETEDGEEAVAVTLEDVQLAYDAAIASCQSTIDEIFARLENGENFADLIPEYNTDPGMNNEETVKNGYMAHPDSYMDGPFLEAAFSEKMTKPGDVSDPALGMYGIYIVYYLRDVEGGAIELTDELFAEIKSMLENDKLGLLYNQLVAEWAEELDVTYDAAQLKAVCGIDVIDGKLVAPELDEEVPEQD